MQRSGQSDFSHLIVAGVPRSGSTSLYTYLLHHPEICGSTVKETQHFLPAAEENPVAPLSQYLSFFSLCDKQKYLMEASPSYFFGGEQVAQVIKQQLQRPKLIFILRNPVDRFFSFYTHEIMFGNLSKHITFDEFINSPETKEKQLIHSGFYINYLLAWYESFGTDIYLIFFDDLFNYPLRVMQSLSNWLIIDPTFYEDFEFTQENRGAVYKNRKLHMASRAINGRFETFLRRNLGIKRLLRTLYYAVNESQAEKPVLSPKAQEYLKNVYRPYNQELYRFLFEKGVPISGWLLDFAPIANQDSP